MKNSFKKIMALALAVCLCAALCAPAALAAYEGVPGTVGLTVTANEQSDGTYNVRYRATLNMPVGLARAAAEAIAYQKLKEFQFVCTLTDTIIGKDTRPDGTDVSGLYTISGPGSSYYEFLSAEKSGSNIIMKYKLVDSIVDDWKTVSIEDQAAHLQETVIFESVTGNVPASQIDTTVESTATVDVMRTSDKGATYYNILGAGEHAAIGKAILTRTAYVAPGGPSTPTPSTGDDKITIVPSDGESGTGETDGGKVTIITDNPGTGDKVEFDVDVNPGKHVDSITITDEDGNNITYEYTGDGKFDFVMPDGKVEIHVNYDDNPYMPEDSGVNVLLNTDDHILYIRGDKITRLVRIDENVKRSEVATMFYRLLRRPNVPYTERFVDVADTDWFAEAVHVIRAVGVFDGYEDGTFRAYNPMTRAEFIKTCVGFSTKDPKHVVLNFSDIGGSWAYDAIAKAAAFGWINGYPDGTLRPNQYISRIECMIIINKMLGRPSDEVAIEEGKETTFPDLSTSYWGYNYVAEASTEHDPEVDRTFYAEDWFNIIAQNH